MGIINQTHKNAIINGDFIVWQRGTSFPAIAINDYSADRWYYHKGGTMVHTVTRETDVPTVSESRHKSNYSLKMDCTTAQAVITANDHTYIRQIIEGYNFVPFVGKTATLSFWVKATKTGIYCVAFRNEGLDRSYIVEYTVNSSDTWEKKEVKVTFDYSGGTWNYTNGTGLGITWALAIGSNYHGVKDTWQTGVYLATSNQVNACDNIANNFSLSQVQFELGETASPFESKTIQQELRLCQRYYYRFINGTNEYHNPALIGSYGNGANGYIKFPVDMRANPTVIIMAANGTINSVNDLTSAGALTSLSNYTATINGITRVYKQSTYTAGHVYSFHYEADAEL